MPKSTRNRGNRWTPSQVSNVRRLAAGNTPTGVIALKMRRTKAGIYSLAQRKGISLNPTNRRPYTRRRR